MKHLPLLLLLLPQEVAPGTRTESEAAGSITEADVKAHIAFLASDAMAGRETGSDELVKAAEYIAARFEKAGLKPLGADGTFLAWYKLSADKKAPNCIGLLEGSDPTLKNEVLVVGANMDHLGKRGTQIFHGADANASGTAGVLELAQAFAALKARPKRSILFVTFSGGEMGMLGSEAYVNSPAIPIEKTAAMFNLDMIGRSKEGYLFVGGVKTAAEWSDRVKRLGAKHKLTLETAGGGQAPTDSVNFFRKGVPVLHFFTNVHADYHRPTDEASKIDAAAEVKILQMAFDVILETAQAKERPTFKADDSEAVPRDFYERLAGGQPPPRTPKVRLGVNVDPVKDGVKLTSVAKGSNAEAAGLKVGDILRKVGDKAVRSQEELIAALADIEPGESAKVTYARDGKDHELSVKFAK